ncbi:MAG: Lrp/AsnC family transcriptional regulator [Desulfobacteraceae bacterium]|nr:MAG: Lrp/AsnC family transcriptional regulator [Desulfobacteraceae bacterium]
MIDETGLKILSILQDKARIPNVEVARQVGMAPSAVLERIRKLEKQGIIDGYEVRLNPKRFNRNLMAFVHVQTDMQADRMSVGQALSGIPEVQEVHFVAGEDGYLIKVRVADTGELQKFLEKKILSIKAVHSVRTNIVMTTLKETSRIPLEETDSELIDNN